MENLPTLKPSQSTVLRLPEVLRRIGHSKSWLYKAIQESRFVPPVKIGSSSCWDSLAVQAWIDEHLRPQGASESGVR